TQLLEKVARAYSRLIELAQEERTLEEHMRAHSHTQPTNERQRTRVTRELERIRIRMGQLRRQQEQWRAESVAVLRIPSKEVAQIFQISPAAVDKRIERIGRRVRAALNRRRADDAPAET